LKVLSLRGKIKCPVIIELARWEKLKVYWSKLEIERKAEHMINVMNLVKKLSNVGRLGRARKEA
jgi:hypothetical protein